MVDSAEQQHKEEMPSPEGDIGIASIITTTHQVSRVNAA